MQADHNLPHLHSGVRLEKHAELRCQFNMMACQDVRIAHYIAYKRSFAPGLLAVYEIIRNSLAWEGIDINHLAREDKPIYCQNRWHAWTQAVNSMGKKGAY